MATKIDKTAPNWRRKKFMFLTNIKIINNM